MTVASLADRGPAAVMAVSTLFFIAWVAVLLARQPLSKQRLSEGAVVAGLLLVIGLLTPLPRWQAVFPRSSTSIEFINEAEAASDPNDFAPPNESSPMPAKPAADVSVSLLKERGESPETDWQPSTPARLPTSDRAADPLKTREASISDHFDPPRSQTAATTGVEWRIDWPRWRLGAALVYLTAVGCGALWLLGARWRLHRLVNRCRSAEGDLAKLWQTLSSPAEARLLVAPSSGAACGPICFGIRRPTVVVHASVVASRAGIHRRCTAA